MPSCKASMVRVCFKREARSKAGLKLTLPVAATEIRRFSEQWCGFVDLMSLLQHLNA